MVGNAGFFKMDFTLTPHEALSMRLSTSRYSGLNNVFLDPSSPLTTNAISENGEQHVATETGSVALNSTFSWRLISHLRAQFSHDLQESSSNATDPLTEVRSIIDGFGRSNILPRQTREHRLQVAETISLEGKRNSWKIGGDALLSWIYNYFPSQAGGEYIFDLIKVNPFTFEPQEAGLLLTPLRAYAHDVPKYYIQNFGNQSSHPDTNEYSGFLQDTIRATSHLAISLGARYDLQTFTKKGLLTNPLWPDSGKIPFNPDNFAPRVGRCVLFRGRRSRWSYERDTAGSTLAFRKFTLPPSPLITVSPPANLFLENSNYYDHQVFPQYPNALVNCPLTATSCTLPPSLAQYSQAGVSAFASNFKTPKVEQASLGLEQEVAHRLAVGVSYMYVHGVDLIRALDENLPPPVNVQYPVYDSTGTNFLGTFYNVQSFSTWQMTSSFTCPYPPCINPLARPIPQLGAIDVFQSAASSVYNGMTFSIHRQMTSGLYFRLAYTFAKAIDDGQDALVAGQPALVQNSYNTAAEKGLSVTDQRHRLMFAWIADPKIFGRDQPLLEKVFNDWKLAGVLTFGSGRPENVMVSGDPNQDGNENNDRLPGAGRDSFIGPDYATTDARLTRRLYVRDRLKLDLVVESFNLLNRDNKRVLITQNGLESDTAYFVKISNELGVNYYPGHFQIPSNPLRTTNAYSPRQVQLALKMIF